MSGSAKGRGFILGAVVGLALALLVVGAASVVPGASAPVGVRAAARSQTVSATSTTLPGALAKAASGPAVEAGIAVPSAAPSAAPPQAPVSGVPPGRPSSLLAALPGEGAAKLVETVSPLLVALAVAGIVYGAYSRRQD